MEHTRRPRSFAVAGPLCAALALLLLATAAHADEASLIGEGGNLRPMAGHSTVRLVQAEVQVRILEPTPAERKRLCDSARLPAESANADDPWAAVECTFALENTGAATTVKMGFPEQSWTGSSDDGDPLPGPYGGFASFQSWVDGKPWKTTTSEWRPVDKRGFEQLRWRMKEVPFAAHQTRTVRDAYVMQLGYAGGSADWFRYTLSTGASWHGPIGRERVTLDLSGLRKWQLVSATPQSGRLPPATDKVVWEWRNFEPQGKTAEAQAEFLRGQYALVSRHMHSWGGVRSDQMQHREGLAWVPADAVLGPYCQDEMAWDEQTKQLKIRDVPGAPSPVVLAAGRKALVAGGRTVPLPVAPYVAPTPPGYRNDDLFGEAPAQTLFVPLDATVRALGGHVYRLYTNGPLCLSFPAPNTR